MPNDYTGNAAFLQSLADGLTPDPLMTVAEWADNYRILSGRAAAEAGKYRTSRTPYMREIMENLSPSSPPMLTPGTMGTACGMSARPCRRLTALGATSPPR